MTPKLLVDFVNTPVLHDAEIVLHDIDPAPLPRMVDLLHHLAAIRGISLTARGTTDRRDALRGADFVDDEIAAMTDEVLAATAAWLPHFARA